MKKVIVSILDYNGQDKTLACLRSLENLVLPDIFLEVLVIDNYPQGKFTVDKKLFPSLEITIIKTKENKGFAGGHNVGFEYAIKKQIDFIVILNNDTYVDKNLIKELVRSAEENPQRAAVVPKIYFAKGFEYHKDRYKKDELGKVFWYAGGSIDWDNINGVHRGVDEVDKKQYDDEQETELLTGCCVLFRTDILQKTGGFDDRYFLYYEDADLNERIHRLGFVIWYNPNAVLWHINAGSTGGSGSNLQDYFISRNRLLFGFRFARFRTKAALLRESVRILFTGRKWQRKGVIDFFRHRYGKGSFAL
ncbi:MAG: glycosyltransferase family 2 protein [Candidatus Levybacteria bacterium]|nr:glycosyltransferase family 2 protein [Candidatus Levybacteria bacterium]